MRYLAYLLRLWQVQDETETGWRASVESPHTGERRGFADPEALFMFLNDKMRLQSKCDEMEEENE